MGEGELSDAEIARQTAMRDVRRSVQEKNELGGVFTFGELTIKPGSEIYQKFTSDSGENKERKLIYRGYTVGITNDENRMPRESLEAELRFESGASTPFPIFIDTITKLEEEDGKIFIYQIDPTAK